MLVLFCVTRMAWPSVYIVQFSCVERLLVTRQRLSYEEVNLHNTLVTWAWDACVSLTNVGLYSKVDETPIVVIKNICTNNKKS